MFYCSYKVIASSYTKRSTSKSLTLVQTEQWHINKMDS